MGHRLLLGSMAFAVFLAITAVAMLGPLLKDWQTRQATYFYCGSVARRSCVRAGCLFPCLGAVGFCVDGRTVSTVGRSNYDCAHDRDRRDWQRGSRDSDGRYIVQQLRWHCGGRRARWCVGVTVWVWRTVISAGWRGLGKRVAYGICRK